MIHVQLPTSAWCRALRHVVAAGVRSLALVAALAGVTLAPPAAFAQAEAEEPDEVVRQVSDDILDIIEGRRDSFDADPDGFYAAVDARMDDFVDYEAIARAVMAQYWETATPEQRARFAVSFRRGLVRSYGRALLEFEQQKIDVLPMKPEHRRGNRALVRMEITSANGRIYPLQYSMAQDDDGDWLVRNVIVDGVNLGLTYRNQFASAMQSGDGRGDIDAVIDSWSVPTAPTGG
ncbi:MAG TPA: ABC transporter substrate-binding protein [Pseudomonadales bacterium]|nr:ABC transporter substrate-binding protein [Pseudomonadales bacterium]